MSLSTLNNSFIPYSLSGLSNINTDTINGTSPFNGVSTSGAYQLSYNTTTGILSMQPIGQLLETTSGPTFNNIILNTTGTITSGAYGLFLTTTSQYIQLFNNGSYARILFSSLNNFNYFGTMTFKRADGVTTGTLGYPTAINTLYLKSDNNGNLNLEATGTGANVNINSTNAIQFNNNINFTSSRAITTTTGRININPANFTTRFNNDGVKGFVEIECAGATTTGQVLFYLPNGTLQALMRADSSYFYFFNLNAMTGCVYYTKGGVVFYCSYGQATGTGEIVFKDNNVEVFTANAINGLTMKNSNRIQSASGTNLILNAPTGQQINFNINNTNIGFINSSGLTVNNIASNSSNNLSLSSANNNVNITALSTIGGTGAGNINLNFERFVSFNNNGVEVARIDTSNGRLIFPNLSSISAYNTPIYFSGTGTNYIASGASTVGFFTGNNIFSVSPTPSGEMIAKINNVTILKINSADGLTTNLITANTATNLTLNTLSSVAILFNIASSNVGYIGSSGLYINRITSKSPIDDLTLDSQSGVIISAPSTKDIRLQIGTNTILTATSAGVSIQSLFTNGLTSNAFNNLVFDTPSGQKINFNIAGYNIGYVNSSALIFNNISSDTVTSSDLNLNAPTSQKINFNINNSASVAVDNLGLTSSNSSFFIKNSNSLRDIVLQSGAGVSVCDYAGTYIVRFNVAGSQIYLPYFASGYYPITLLTSTFGNYYNHYISGTTYQIINASSVGVQLTYGSTSWASASDKRLKKNIQPLKNSLELINQLNPITYNWKDENMTNNNIGFIAQEVEKVIPEITEDYDIKGDKYLGIRTTDLIPFLVKSIQQLSKELKDMNHFVSNICQDMTNMKTILKNHNLI